MIIQTYILKTILHRTTFLTAVACLIIAMINSITLLEFLVKKSLTGMGFFIDDSLCASPIYGNDITVYRIYKYAYDL